MKFAVATVALILVACGSDVPPEVSDLSNRYKTYVLDCDGQEISKSEATDWAETCLSHQDYETALFCFIDPEQQQLSCSSTSRCLGNIDCEEPSVDAGM